MGHWFDAGGIDLVKLIKVANNAVQLLGKALALVISQAKPGQFRNMVDIFDSNHLLTILVCGASFYVRQRNQSSGILAERAIGVNCELRLRHRDS
jgi:hypothetical protein